MPPTHPREQRTEFSAKDPSIRDKTLEPAALQPPSAVSDPQKHLRHAPTSETGDKPINCSDTKATDRKKESWKVAHFFKTEEQYNEMKLELQEWNDQGRPDESYDPIIFYCPGGVVQYF